MEMKAIKSCMALVPMICSLLAPVSLLAAQNLTITDALGRSVTLSQPINSFIVGEDKIIDFLRILDIDTEKIVGIGTGALRDSGDGLRAPGSQAHPLASVALIQCLFSKDTSHILVYQQEPFPFLSAITWSPSFSLSRNNPTCCGQTHPVILG
jgi:hypothetical protein